MKKSVIRYPQDMDIRMIEAIIDIANHMIKFPDYDIIDVVPEDISRIEIDTLKASFDHKDMNTFKPE